METSIFTADGNLVKNAKRFVQKFFPRLVFIPENCKGDQFISDNEKKEWLLRNFDGYCTEMEGAAIAQAASLNQIPFLIIRDF